MAMVIREARRHGGTKAPRVRRRGLAALEFALVSVPLMLLLVGLIDYGFIFLKAQQITQAARAGARAAVLPDATNASVDAAIDALLTDAGIDSYSLVLTPADVTTVAPGTAISVEVTVTTEQLALIDTSLLPVPAQLKATASMAKEGP